jgi:hypothetical protein
LKNLFSKNMIKDLKDFIFREIEISKEMEIHKENGKKLFGNNLEEDIYSIHKSIAMQKKMNGSVSDKTIDILATMFAENIKNT